MIRFLFLLCVFPGLAAADSVLAAVTIRAHTILTADHLMLSDMDMPGAATDLAALVGMEARVNLYANRPIQPRDVGAPTVIERNQIVPLVFHAGGLAITTEARALGRAGVGDTLRVMNLASRSTVFGIVTAQGAVSVSPLMN
jgi:flagella basal body P-ring formation protein FlgA